MVSAKYLKTVLYNCVVAMLFFASITILICTVKKLLWGVQDSYVTIIQKGFSYGFLMTVMFASAYFFFSACKWVMKQ